MQDSFISRAISGGAGVLLYQFLLKENPLKYEILVVALGCLYFYCRKKVKIQGNLMIDIITIASGCLIFEILLELNPFKH